MDGDPDPGEIVWTWVPYEEDPEVGKDRPVLVVAHMGSDVAAVQMTSMDHDRDAAQPAAPPGVAVVDKFLLQAAYRLPGAWIIQRQMHEVHFRNLFTLGKQGVEGKGHDLGLPADGGDEGGGFGCSVQMICHSVIQKLMYLFRLDRKKARVR